MRLLALVLLFWMPLATFGQEWESIVPENFEAEHCVFTPQPVYASSYNLFYEIDVGWITYDYDLAITDILRYSNNEILVAEGAGSYSDAIYRYNINTHTSTHLDWLPEPKVLKYIDSVLYVGGEYGLFKLDSANELQLIHNLGAYNYLVEYFIDGDNEIMLVNKEVYSNQKFVIKSYIRHSEDGGDTWQNDTLSLWVVDALYDHATQKLYMALGISGTDADGIYETADNGASINQLKSLQNVNSLFHITENTLAVGVGTDEVSDGGVKLLSLNTNSLTDISGDLPHRHVNEVTANQWLNCLNLIACTDSGVYKTLDINSIAATSFSNQLHVKPNPAKDYLFVTTPENFTQPVSIQIFNMQGKCVSQHSQKQLLNQPFKINVAHLSGGLYILKVKSAEQHSLSKKIVLQ